MSANVSCDSNGTFTLSESLNFIAFSVVAPVYFVFGVSARTICLVAFYKQYKKEKAYAYQMFMALYDMLAIITFAACTLTLNNFAGFRLPGALWFQRNYVLMWYSAHLASPLDQSFITVTLLASLCMTADRVFALLRPLSHKAINHSRHQAVAASVCLFLGLATSAFDVCRYKVVKKGDLYELAVNYDYLAAVTAYVLAQIRNVVRFVGNIALVACNVIMVVSYRNSVLKVTVALNNDDLLAKRKRIERTLILLTLCQSIYSTINISLWNAYYGLVYGVLQFTACNGKIMAPINDLVMQVGEVVQFVVIWSVSKQFRATVRGSLRCKLDDGG